LFGCFTIAVFYFGDKGLSQIEMSPSPRDAADAPAEKPEVAIREWYKTTFVALKEKFGKGECVTEPSENCIWRTRGVVRASLTMESSALQLTATLTLLNPGDAQPAKPKPYWAKAHWADLYIGMTPEDATNAFETQPEIVFGHWPSGEESGVVGIEWPGEQFGLPAKAGLFFRQGRLSSIVITQSATHPWPDGKEGHAAQLRWFAAAKKELGKQHGAAKCSTDNTGEYCIWRKDGIVNTALILSTETAQRPESAAIQVEDPGPEPPPEADPKTVTRKTDPKAWSTAGWQDFRWGMGIGDVQRLIRDKKGAFRATEPASCRLSTTWRDVIDCDLGPTLHNFEIFNSKPFISFQFLGGDLISAYIHLTVDSMDDAVVAYAKLRDLLRSKYGTPEPYGALEASLPAPGKVVWTGELKWVQGSLEVSLMGMISHARPSVGITYSDPVRQKAAFAHPLGLDAEAEKL
jgi:hypothetical protein